MSRREATMDWRPGDGEVPLTRKDEGELIQNDRGKGDMLSRSEMTTEQLLACEISLLLVECLHMCYFGLAYVGCLFSLCSSCLPWRDSMNLPQVH